MELDLRSILIYSSFINVLFAVVMIFTWQLALRKSGTGFWAVGFVLTAFGQIFVAVRDLFPLAVSVIFGNLTLVTGFGCIIYGLQILLQNKNSKIVYFILTAICISGILVFLFLWPSLAIRIVIYTVVLLFLMVKGILICIRVSNNKIRFPSLSLAFILILLAAAYVIRLIPGFFNIKTEQLFSLPYDSMLLIITMIVFYVFSLLLLVLLFALNRADQEILLEEKETLYQEMNHRTKNNLSLIESIISLKLNSLPVSELKEHLTDLQSRIRTISQIHDQLYKENNNLILQTDEYLKSLIDGISQSTLSGISLQTDICPLPLDAKRALALGLLVNELVTNSIKHAFPQGLYFPGERNKTISVQLKNNSDSNILKVSDNGIGLDPNKITPGLGTLLIENLVSQISGKLERKSDQGTSIQISFS